VDFWSSRRLFYGNVNPLVFVIERSNLARVSIAMHCEARTGTNGREAHSPDAGDPHGQGDTPIEAKQQCDWVVLHRATVGFARVWCKRRDEALDVAQDAMVAFLRRQMNVQRPLPYLFVVTRRAATHLARREACRTRSEQVWLEDSTRQGRYSSSRALLNLLIYERSARLSVRQKRLLLYRALGYTDTEIARKISRPRHNIGPLLARAMERLRDPRPT
jgi:RNA polymerase sigma factor (sigma-70 family)